MEVKPEHGPGEARPRSSQGARAFTFLLVFGAIGGIWLVPSDPSPRPSRPVSPGAPLRIARVSPSPSPGPSSSSPASRLATSSAPGTAPALPETRRTPAPLAPGASPAASPSLRAPRPPGGSTPAIVDGKYRRVTLLELADYREEDPTGEKTFQQDPAGGKVRVQLPPGIAKLHGERVALEGYMIPMQLQRDRVLRFLLVSQVPQCCFADSSFEGEWVDVVMPAGQSVPHEPMERITVLGKLEIAAEMDPDEMGTAFRIVPDVVRVPQVE